MKLVSALIVVSGLFFSSMLQAEDKITEPVEPLKMTADRLLAVITEYAEDVKTENNLISFSYKKTKLYCVFDSNADRVRIISPIAEAEMVPDQMLIMALQANYHSVLDARYAIGDGIVYSAFIHPLSPLTIAELQSAIRQVATAAFTFGETFSSGELVFPGNRANESKEEDKGPKA